MACLEQGQTGFFSGLLRACKLVDVLIENADSHRLGQSRETGVLHEAPADVLPSALRGDGWQTLVHHAQELTDALLPFPLHKGKKDHM